jgi:protein-tyrosine phosphatase
MAEQRGLPLEVRSAGIFAYPGATMSQYSAHILRERAIEIHFGSSKIDASLLMWADLVLTMTQAHKYEIVMHFPEFRDKIFTLKEYVLVDEQVLANIQAIDATYAEIELQFSLGQSVTSEQREKLRALEKSLPNLDVSDPFAGSLDRYQDCAFDIETHLQLLLNKLQTG